MGMSCTVGGFGNVNRHRVAAAKLLESGQAFTTPSQLAVLPVTENANAETATATTRLMMKI
jgi:hypothetical protein